MHPELNPQQQNLVETAGRRLEPIGKTEMDVPQSPYAFGQSG